MSSSENSVVSSENIPTVSELGAEFKTRHQGLVRTLNAFVVKSDVNDFGKVFVPVYKVNGGEILSIPCDDKSVASLKIAVASEDVTEVLCTSHLYRVEVPLTLLNVDNPHLVLDSVLQQALDIWGKKFGQYKTTRYGEYFCLPELVDARQTNDCYYLDLRGKFV